MAKQRENHKRKADAADADAAESEGHHGADENDADHLSLSSMQVVDGPSPVPDHGHEHGDLDDEPMENGGEPTAADTKGAMGSDNANEPKSELSDLGDSVAMDEWHRGRDELEGLEEDDEDEEEELLVVLELADFKNHPILDDYKSITIEGIDTAKPTLHIGEYSLYGHLEETVGTHFFYDTKNKTDKNEYRYTGQTTKKIRFTIASPDELS